MRIAFYAPLKPPDHPVPSGDRQVARLFVKVLRLAGHHPMLASRFRSFDGSGDGRRQARLAILGRQLADRSLRRYRDLAMPLPDLWFTYHLYHKAPDWLGPRISRTLGIPYVVAEASFAPKRAGGPWMTGHHATEQAIRHADAVIGLNPADHACVLPLLAEPSRWVAVRPFVDADCFHPRAIEYPRAPRLIAAAMMRHGDKLASYRILGQALSDLLDLEWSLEIVGDGDARSEVMTALAPLGSRIIWSGALSPDATAGRLTEADLYVWPAINEAFGMALLEAEAAGLPVVAGDSGGVAGIVAHEITGLLAPPGDAAGFAAAVRRLLIDSGVRRHYGAAARRRVLAEHDLSVAAARIGAILDRLRPARAA